MFNSGMGQRGAAVAAVAAAAAMVTAAPAFAHDSVIGATPEDGSVLQEFPDTIELEFSGEIQDGFNTVAITRDRVGDPDLVYSGEPRIDGRDVILEIPADVEAEPGDYKVGFQIISSDGHATKGMTAFTYDPDGSAQSEASDDSEPANEAAEEEDSKFWSYFALAAVVVVVSLLALLFARNRQKRESGTTVTDEN